MTSIVFPGQGSQFVGMTRDFYDNFSIVKETFDQVESISKINVKKIIFENESGFLDKTKYTQLCIFCSSMSIYNVLINEFDKSILKFNYGLGHSLGEYSALTASNVLTINDSINLLKIRGELMQNAYPDNKSGMAAIIGLNCSSVEKIINENNLNIEVANDNSPLQVVISGIKDDLSSAESILINNGAKKYIHLNVSSAFHSQIMKDAEIEMKSYLKDVVFSNPDYPIISNFSANFSSDKKILFNNLTNQMSNKVRWTESIQQLSKVGEKNILEIGPGKVLSGLIKRITNDFTVISINSIKDLENI